MKKNTFEFSLGVLAVLTLLAAGCTHPGPIRNMELGAGEDSSGPQEGKAMVVFMRPNNLGYDIQSSVFDIKDNQPELVGIVAASTKVAYQVDPGPHLFMVIGESADFMSANLLPNKTYYALVEPRMGMWKARFSLSPVGEEKLDSKEFQKWLRVCRWVEKTPDSEAWAAHNMKSIESKQTAYYPRWTAKPESERPYLSPEDGR
jgi:hypothetical protein